jgi:hypothetical protein
VINDTPVELEGRRLIFIHPKSANGVLVELYELTGFTIKFGKSKPKKASRKTQKK